MKNKRIRNVLVVTMALSLLMAIFSFAPINAAGIPTLTLLSPSSGNLGATLNGVVITGTNLTGATKVTISGIGVTASNVFVGSDTQITATLTIASDATAGLRDVTVTTPGGTSATLAGGFSVMNTAGADVFSLDVPAIVAEGGGFYVTINVKGAYQLTNYYLKLNFDPTVVQMAGLDNSHGTSSGISDGVIGGVTIPNHGWSYQPIAGTPSGTISMLYWGPYASGNGYLAKIYFKVLGAAGNQTKLSLFAIDLVDASYNEMFPADPSPVTIAISANTPLVTAVTTNAATAMTNTTATLSGTLTSLGRWRSALPQGHSRPQA